LSTQLELVSQTDARPTLVTGDRHFFRRLLRRRLALAALLFLGIVILAAIFAPWIAPYPPSEPDLANTLSGPTWAHPFGTDELGRDILSRIMYGGRVTLTGSAIGVGVALLVGVPGGLAAGYLGGRTDWVVARLIEINLAVPGIMILLVVLSIFGHNQRVAMITFGLLVAPNLMWIVRGATLAVRNELYVDAARVLGLSRGRIIARHVYPRIIGVVIVQGSLLAAGAVLTETGLGFLGLGVPPPTPTWGGIVQTASTLVAVQPWLLVPSGLIVVCTVLAFGLLGDALRDTTTQVWLSGSTGTRTRPAAARARKGSDVIDRGEEGSLLSIRGLSVEFPGGLRVVDDVSFDIQPGETVGLIGESGCGKTMTAMAVIGLLPGDAQIESGSCVFSGRDLAQLSRGELQRIRGREIGFIGQNAIASLDPTFTVRSQLGEVVRVVQPELSRREVKQHVLELLGLVRLPDPIDVARRYPHELSGGMAQRVAIAAALAGNPSLLVADEPTTALDVTVQAEILDLLASLQQRTGMAMLLISHDWGVVARTCDRAVVMYAGQLVEEADVIAIFDRPLHPYTEGLLRSNPQGGRDREQLETIPGTVPAPGAWPSGCRFAPRCRYVTAACQLAAVPLLETENARLSRCIHTDRLKSKSLAT
jgi:peptide/nickel transport system permease protein